MELGIWTQILTIIALIFLAWWLYSVIKGNKESFTKENMGKTIQTLGWVAIFLIAVIAFSVLMLK